MRSLRVGVSRSRPTPTAPDPARRFRACVGAFAVLGFAWSSAAQSVSSPPPSSAPVVAPVELARMWSEAEVLERSSWNLGEAEAGRSYELAVEAARRFETVVDRITSGAVVEVDPYRHAYWRTARSLWLAADSLDLSERERRRAHLSRAIEFTDRGIEADPDCAACMLWKFNSMGRRQQIDGLYKGARQVKSMAGLLARGIELQPSFQEEGDDSSTLGNLHYVSAVFYRVLPDWFWLKWFIGVRGDKERALEHAQAALALHDTRIDYRVEVGSQLLCLGVSKDDPERLAEGRRALEAASLFEAGNVDQQKELAAARVMLAAPKKSCSYAGAEWVEIDEDGVISSMD